MGWIRDAAADPGPARRTLVGRVAATILVVALVGGMLVHGAMLWSQTRALEDNLAVTEQIVDANVRTLGQVQRELLRLRTVVLDASAPSDDVEMHRAFVAQRMREMALPYQLKALADASLLEEAEALSRSWDARVQPRVRALAVLADPDLDRSALAAELAAIELEVNDLAARAEIARKAQAGAANAATAAGLGRARAMLVGQVVVVVALLVMMVAVALVWRRLDQQRHRAAVELRTLSQVARTTDNMVVVTDAAGRVEWVNEAFERTTEYDLEDVVGRSPGEVLQGPDTDPAAVAAMSEALARGEGFNVEVVNHTRSGRPYLVAIEVQPVHDDDGRLTNFIAIESDVTEQREYEEDLRRARRAAEETAQEKANFLASMSHEIRTPLNAVIGLTGMLLDSPLSPEQRRHAETARNSGNLLLALINNILNFSSMEAGELELEQRPFTVAGMLEDTMALFGEDTAARGLELGWSVDPDVPGHLVGDETRLRQVLVNLVSNGLKFTSHGGVHVDVRRDPDEADGVGLSISVTDTGIGIPEDRVDRLFRPFSQVDASTSRRFGGTGLGLAICRQVVQAMGGRIVVDSTVGVGTTFLVSVPLEEADPDDVEVDAAVTAVPASSPLRLLLAEDDPVNQIVAVHLLEVLGHTVDIAGNGAEALEALRRRPYDVVLMDVHMPVMDGLEATAAIHAEWGHDRRPAVVAMTANALEGDRERLLTAGMDGYVSKPVRVEELAGALSRIAPGVIPA